MIISVRDHFRELAIDAGKSLLRHTVQLYSTTNIKKPCPICSGVLLAYKDYRFLVSAAHLVKGFSPNSLAVYVKDTLHIPVGNAVIADPRESKINNETDVIVWRLKDEVANDLEKQYEFYSPTETSFNHSVSDKIQYLVVGFPNSKTHANPNTHKIKQDPFIYLAKQSDLKYYQLLRLQEARNLLLDYDRENIKNFKTDQVQTGPWPEGLSGCGIWFLPNPLATKVEDIHSALVGILIEFWDEHNVIVSTRLSVALQLLEKAASETAPNIT